MKLGVLGSGLVAQAIAGKLVERGHEVVVGTRDPAKLAEWRSQAGVRAQVGSFADAAAFGEMVFNCTSGTGSLNALQMAGEMNLNGKVLIDIANPLDFSHGMLPTLAVCNTDSLGEQIQRAFPAVKVVKTLNTVNANLMVNPSLLAGEHDMFVCGNDEDARAQVIAFLKSEFGWKSVIDLGDISAARAMEMVLPIWLRLWGTLQTPMFNLRVVK